MNNRLFVADDVSFNSNLYVRSFLGINNLIPTVSIDINNSDAIKIPTGTSAQRPSTTDESTHSGYIRYNIEKHQYEGYGTDNTWTSLNGVINDAQNTRIYASYPNANSTNNELMFYTAPTNNTNSADAVERMRIMANGNVGIGTINTGYKLDVNGDMQAASYNATSDSRLKTNITSLEKPLDKILQLNGVSYNWINDLSCSKQSGLLAQDVENIIPETVSTSTTMNDQGFYQKSINYNNLIPYLIESVKTLHDENNKLKSIIQKHEEILNSISR